MAKKDLSQNTIEELQKQLKAAKFLFGLLLGLMAGIVALSILLFIKGEKPLGTLASMGAMIPALVVSMNSRKAIEEELKKR